MATLTVQITNRTTGLDLAGATPASSGGDKWLGSSQEMLYIQNLGASSITLTLAWGASGSVDGISPTNKTFTIAAGERRIIGSFPRQYYNDSSDFVNVTYSSVSSVRVMAFQMY